MRLRCRRAQLLVSLLYIVVVYRVHSVKQGGEEREGHGLPRGPRVGA